MSVDSEKYKLSFGAFAINLIYGIICQAKSIAGLTAEIETSPVARKLELVVASRSMYSESFRRYRPDLFRRIFANLLQSRNFLEIPEIRSLGPILLIGGSLFPAVATMVWAKYKEGANALKMHLSFELNRMIPVHFHLLYDTIESMAVEIPECFSKFFDGIEDTIVAFRNDSAQIPYRVVKFASLGESVGKRRQNGFSRDLPGECRRWQVLCVRPGYPSWG